MTRTSRPASTAQPASRSHRGGTLLGLMLGFVLGLAVAAGIAWFFNKSPNPFDSKGGRPDVASPHVSSIEKEKAPQGDRPRFDFSKILPGTEERKPPHEETAAAAPGAETPAAAPAPQAPAQKPDAPGSLYLQAGAFTNEADAEDQRAQLALMGIEASLQTVTVPDKGTVNRVRLGPYKSVEEMNQVKSELQKRGVSTAVIRNP